MKLIKLFTISLLLVVSVQVAAQERGWVAGVEYEQSNFESAQRDGFGNLGSLRSYGFKISGAYNFTFPVVKGLFVRPKVNLNFRWGDQREILYSIPYPDWTPLSDKFNSIGAGINAFVGYRFFKYLEFFTGPSVDWYFYNHQKDRPTHPDISNGATYSYWTFGLGVPLGRFTVEGAYRQHMNTPDADIERNRWSIGVTYRF